jgi:hypothetical protein
MSKARLLALAIVVLTPYNAARPQPASCFVATLQVRTPETVPGIPGQWPEQGKHKLVDAAQLKNEAQELQGMAQALTPQIDQIGNGKLPKELIENLKKIEKLAKHMRGEIS